MTAPDLFLGIDVGTTGTKAVVVDATGSRLGSGYVPYTVTSLGPGLYLQDATEWKQAATGAVRRATRGIEPRRIRSLALSAQGGTLVPVDADNQPLTMARSWLDRRGPLDAARIRAAFGDRGFYERTGWPIAPNNTCVQILALRREEPDLFASAAYFLDTSAYLAHWLVGTPTIDSNIAGITQLMDVADEQWDKEVLELLEIDASRLPTIVAPGQVLGRLTARASEELGLAPGIPLVAGAHDQYCAALGAGVVGDGDLMLSTGTAWVVLALAHDVYHDHRKGVAFGRALVPELWGHFAEVPNGGVSIEWFRRLWRDADFGSIELEALEGLVAQTEPGSGGVQFFPHFAGTNPHDGRGTSAGTFLGLDLAHDRRHLLRAVMEGVAFEAAEVMRNYARSVGHEYTPVVVGGATNSATWTQMTADIVGHELRVSSVAETACVGAAMLAAVGAGEFDSTVEASTSMQAPRLHVLPRPQTSALYAELAERHTLSARHLAHLYDDLHTAGPGAAAGGGR